MSATSHPRRAKKVVAATIGLAVVFAGIAFAFFSSQESYGNQVTGGDLKVKADLPLEFGTQTLYPTSATEPDTAIVDSFTITNDNPVTAGYSIFATNTSDSPEGVAQYEDLYIKISTTTTSTTTSTVVPGAETPLDEEHTTANAPDVYYEGPLSGLSEASPRFLGTLEKGKTRTYDVAVWLVDDGTKQPQGVPTDFDLTLIARTPGAAPGDTATQNTTTQS